MPQLDRIIITSQIFWLFVIFTTLYIILTHFFLPKFLKVIKARKQIVDINNQEVLILNTRLNERQILLKQLVNRNLSLIEKVLKKKIENLNLNNLNPNAQSVDEKIAQTSIINILYCNNSLLNSIIIFPKALNLKFKS